jgi:integrase
MAKKRQAKLKGVSSVTRNGVQYWYARTGGVKLYCGKGDEGRAMAEAARSKHVSKLYETREVRAGIVSHCLRHTRTSKWVEAGFSDEIIRRATGHRSLQAYRDYAKLDPSAVMRLVSKTAKDSTRTSEISSRQG